MSLGIKTMRGAQNIRQAAEEEIPRPLFVAENFSFC
jgi:hypothetical protein